MTSTRDKFKLFVSSLAPDSLGPELLLREYKLFFSSYDIADVQSQLEDPLTNVYLTYHATPVAGMSNVLLYIFDVMSLPPTLCEPSRREEIVELLHFVEEKASMALSAASASILGLSDSPCSEEEIQQLREVFAKVEKLLANKHKFLLSDSLTLVDFALAPNLLLLRALPEEFRNNSILSEYFKTFTENVDCWSFVSSEFRSFLAGICPLPPTPTEQVEESPPEEDTPPASTESIVRFSELSYLFDANNVLEVAALLKIDVFKETRLLTMVLEMLQTPPPPMWTLVRVKTDPGDDADELLLYRNDFTNELVNEHPALRYYDGLMNRVRQLERMGQLQLAADSKSSWMKFPLPPDSPDSDVEEKVDGDGMQQMFSPKSPTIAATYVNMLTLDEAEELPAGQGLLAPVLVGQVMDDPTPMVSAMASEKPLGADPPVRKRGNAFKVMEFRSSWLDLVNGSQARRVIDIRFFVEDGSCDVSLCGSSKVYHLTMLADGIRKPLCAYNLFVGGRIPLLGQFTTLQQATTRTIGWLDQQFRRLRRSYMAFLKEVGKYQSVTKFDITPLQKHNLTGNYDLGKLQQLVDKLFVLLSGIRPRVADQLARKFPYCVPI